MAKKHRKIASHVLPVLDTKSQTLFKPHVKDKTRDKTAKAAQRKPANETIDKGYSSTASDERKTNESGNKKSRSPAEQNPRSAEPKNKMVLANMQSKSIGESSVADKRNALNGAAKARAPKRKKEEVRPKKRAKLTSTSDSDEENYIDKFFDHFSSEDSEDGKKLVVAVAKQKQNSKATQSAKPYTITSSGWIVEENDDRGSLLTYSDSECDEKCENAFVSNKVTAKKRKDVKQKKLAFVSDSSNNDSPFYFDDDFSSEYDNVEDSPIEVYSDSEDSVDDECESGEEYFEETLSPSDADLYIPKDAATVYDCNDDSIVFGHDSKAGQIIELPADYKVACDDIVPELVPIYSENGELIDSSSKLSAQRNAGVIGELLQPSVGDQLDETLSMSGFESDEDPTTNIRTNFSYRFFDAIDSRKSLLIMKKQIYLYGHVSIQPLFGSVEIMGYTLDAGESRTVYAARGFNALNLNPVPTPDAFKPNEFEAFLAEQKTHFIDVNIDDLRESFDPNSCVLVLLNAEQQNRDSVSIVNRYLEEYNLFPTSTILTKTISLRSTEHLLDVRLLEPETKAIPLFQANPAWDTVQLGDESRLVVLGGKGSGKSTLCQYLANRSLKSSKRVLLLDLDIGQPLLMVPETMSASVLQEPLLGVGCFGKVQPVRCQLFGSLNVVTSPISYIQNVRTLVEYCKADPQLRGVPWVVNTMGYVTGFGEELTAAIVRLIQPTDVIQLTMPARFKGVRNYLKKFNDEFVNRFTFNILKDELNQNEQKQLAYHLHSLDVMFSPSGCPLVPAKRRNLSVMVQLVRILAKSTEWFTEANPVCIPLDELEVLVTREDKPTKDMLPSVLKATLVYICQRLDEGQLSCLGVGIVRTVDTKRNVHLLHYLQPEQLVKAKVLALCNTCLPNQIKLKLNSGMKSNIPYLQNVADPPSAYMDQPAE
ncbi:polynucleotide 5'-hydroxyl-kinase NOL9 [Anopheles bellator]|uniref:polynucleotide 5'-hydroxyl-kinase NOL9 n=1 Tax=Anopheles bellator TaxID=139047 RepID=UPI002647ACE8|nr:polynucleotide 5'-hydroxyl-kinase NOL9 [Anopheles bellator]